MCRQIVASLLVVTLGGVAPVSAFAEQRIRPIEEPLITDPGRAKLVLDLTAAAQTLRRVDVLLCDNHRIRGVVLGLSVQSFTFQEERSGYIRHIRYDDTVVVLPKRRHLALKGVVAGVATALTLRYLFSQVQR